tara:strand:+ start:1086 stop:2768 length:1683 start_codon:yes stop_codon:yes gene_type:complete
MASTPSERLSLRLIGTGDFADTWGAELNSDTLALIDEAVSGVEEISLTGNITLSTTLYQTNQARNRVLRFTDGGLSSAPTISLPATERWYVIQNATGGTYALTFSNGSSTVTVAANIDTAIIWQTGSTLYGIDLAKGTDVATIAPQIANNNLQAVAGQIAPTNNLSTVAGINSDITTVANPTYKALVEVVGEATYKALVEVVGETNYKALVEVVGESVYKSLVETVGNATYKALVEVVGETNYKALVETVGESVYKSVVETVGEAVYKAKVETVADATYKSQIEALNDVTYKAQLQDIATNPYKPLVETVGNATYKALVEVVGESTYKALVETVGNSTYKALVEVVGESVYKGKVEIVANNQPAVSNVSSNISNVNNFNDLYQISASNPSTDGGGNALSQGDLFFDSTNNELKVYNGSAWQGGVTASANFVLKSNNLNDLASASQARTNLGGVITEISQDTSPALGGDLQMGSFSISDGVLRLKNTGSQSELRLYCESGNAHYTGIKSSPHAQYSGNLTFVLPATVGAAGQVLTDVAGNGVLAWSTPSGGGSVATQMKFE